VFDVELAFFFPRGPSCSAAPTAWPTRTCRPKSGSPRPREIDPAAHGSDDARRAAGAFAQFAFLELLVFFAILAGRVRLLMAAAVI